jgi:hypothetical protein
LELWQILILALAGTVASWLNIMAGGGASVSVHLDGEWFFKWIKQNLIIKTFVVASKNVVLTRT